MAVSDSLLVQVGTRFYLRPDDVVSLRDDDDRVEILCAPEAGSLMSSVRTLYSDWPFNRVRDALGLTDLTGVKAAWDRNPIGISSLWEDTATLDNKMWKRLRPDDHEGPPWGWRS